MEIEKTIEKRAIATENARETTDGAIAKEKKAIEKEKTAIAIEKEKTIVEKRTTEKRTGGACDSSGIRCHCALQTCVLRIS
jgi:hypothetical protein